LAISGLNASNLPVECDAGEVTSTRVPRKGQCSFNTNMPQLQVGGWRGYSSLELFRLQPCHGRDTKENCRAWDIIMMII
jgi:hypothetical protein